MHPGTYAASQPDKVAYVMAESGQEVTYRELDDDSNRLAQLLWDRGLRPGDAIAVCMENNAEYLKVLWAAHRSGLYYTAASSRLTQDELSYIVNDCGATALIVSSSLREQATGLLATTPNVEVRLVVGDAVQGYDDFANAIGRHPPQPLPEQPEGKDLLYSSGTTGRPKGVKFPLSGQSIDQASYAVAALGALLYKFNPGMVYLSPAPLYHAAPLRFTMAVTMAGGTAVIMEHFAPRLYLELIERYRVTHTQLVPTMFVRLLKLDDSERSGHDLSSLQVAVHAAAPCPVPVKRQMIEWWGPVIYEYYAGTEGNGFVACDSHEWMAHQGTVGRALVGVIHVVGEDGEEVAAGESGTVYFEGGNQFEYLNDPEKTKGSYNKRGWSTLGDVGYLDEDGYLYLTDRKAYMIISGGVNIYPQEAENVLVTHPKVMDAAVFGVPNEEMGEEVKAVVQPIDLAQAGPELERELIAFCKEHLASFKCPRSVDFEAELPRHPTGKLYKRLLKDRYWSDQKRIG